MTYRGHIKNGVAVLDPGVALPDGMPVRVQIELDDSQFRLGKSLDELAREQGVRPIGSPAELAIDWPHEESLDDLAALVREVRR